MSTDYEKQKVPELKKILAERSLPVSGNKADLIARLQESDSKLNGGEAKKVTGGATGDDEIDWDEDDDNTASTKPVEPTTAAPTAAKEETVKTITTTTTITEKPAAEAAKVSETKTEGEAPKADVEAPKTTEVAAVPEVPKVDFTAGIEKTDAEKEAEKREARAKRFALPEDDEEKKLAERAKKFGIPAKEDVIKGLDSALSDRKPKRGREGRDDKDGGRAAKRQTPDRRNGAPQSKTAAPAARKPAARGGVQDDPVEKAKAEARAKRFAATS